VEAEGVIKGINTRELILGILLETEVAGSYSHVVIRNVLEKYQYLEQKDRAFIKRVSEGTIEYKIRLDYIINQFSNVKTAKMKPVILNLLRMSVYQFLYMDHVPASAICNEAVKLAEKKGFYNLKGFVNGVLRNISRNIENIKYPSAEKEPMDYLSVSYSMPMWIVKNWCERYGFEKTEQMLLASLSHVGTTIRCNESKISKEQLEERLKKEGVSVEKAKYLEYAFLIMDYDYLGALKCFREGLFQVQDISSMLVGEIAAVKKGMTIIDVCAAPGGKSLHLADKLCGTGIVEARDLTEAKVELIRSNVKQAGFQNVKVITKDATIFDEESVNKADILIADLPCSGLGVLSRKGDIKYHMTEAGQTDLVKLQRKILHTIHTYVKPGGILIYSTCTINEAENEENLNWFLSHYPYQTESLNPYLPKELINEETESGYLQLLPGIHDTDGFFMARLKRV